MDISGLVQSYDPRAASSAAISRNMLAPQYAPVHSYTNVPSHHNMIATHQQLQHHNPFHFNAYSGATPNVLVPTFANHYTQQRPLPPLAHSDDVGSRGVLYSRVALPGYLEEHHSQTPPVKPEQTWSPPAQTSARMSAETKTVHGTDPANEAEFGTEVDILMKAIQAKSEPVRQQVLPPVEQNIPVAANTHVNSSRQEASRTGMYHSELETKFKLTQGGLQKVSGSPRVNKKRYQCTIEDCHKSFYQKTHLDIHERAHTGAKPYPCKEPGCGRYFSQLGNLRTHQRRHTGERPYACEICGKRFAQRGNVRAHRIVHDQAKPYLCRLEDCGKRFTQLGNLKSHQNKFHIETIRQLAAKFGPLSKGELGSAAEREIWEYFADLYKNSNKGIKGRGKDRKVGPNPPGLVGGMRNLRVDGRGAYMDGPGRSNIDFGYGMGGGHGAGKVEGVHYDMFEGDEGSQSSHSSHSGNGGGSVGTCYDDAPSDGFEDTGRSHELAFGDRIY